MDVCREGTVGREELETDVDFAIILYQISFK